MSTNESPEPLKRQLTGLHKSSGTLQGTIDGDSPSLRYGSE